jgi:hypothetical protein
MPAIERVAEIFERLFVLETALVGELLAELACCTPEELHKLFGNPLTRRVAAAPATAALSRPPSPSTMARKTSTRTQAGVGMRMAAGLRRQADQRSIGRGAWSAGRHALEPMK